MISEPLTTLLSTKSSQPKRENSSFYCDLSALDNEQRKRHSTLTEELLSKHLEFKELIDGYGMRFPYNTSLFTAIAEWATLEHLCCPFLALTLEMHQDKGPIWLKLSGNNGVKDFLRAELGI